jgi:hypothetical protein
MGCATSETSRVYAVVRGKCNPYLEHSLTKLKICVRKVDKRAGDWYGGVGTKDGEP